MKISHQLLMFFLVSMQLCAMEQNDTLVIKSEENYFNLLPTDIIFEIADKLDENSWKPFLDTCEKFDNCTEFLLQRNRPHQPFIFAACQVGAIRWVRNAIKHDSQIVCARNYCNQIPLHISLIYKHFDIAELLIKKNSPIDARDNQLLTPLHLAAAKKGSVDVAKLLIDKKANINNQTDYKNTPLHMAVFYNHPEAVQLLVESGADVNIKDFNERTPLEEARSMKSTEIIAILEKKNQNNCLLQ